MLSFFPGSKTRDLQCILLFMIFRSTSRYAGYTWNSKRVAISRMPSTEWPLMPTVALSVVLSQCVDALESRKAKQKNPTSPHSGEDLFLFSLWEPDLVGSSV